MLPETGLMKLIAATTAASGGAVLVAAAVTGTLPVPLPEGHTILEFLGLSAAGYIWTQIRAMNATMNKKMDEKPPSFPPILDVGEKQTLNGDWLARRIEDIASGVQTGNERLSDHREEFAEFRGETRARLGSLESKAGCMGCKNLEG